jgi:2-polyprenyl-3-methyl-5-hydroxy-6-metoxy-1,4-benzoquinol methylase
MTLNSTDKENLTEVEFWNEYWSNCILPTKCNLELPFERCLARALGKYLNKSTKGKVLEIGCAPGKWLAFMARKFNLEPHGIEYSELGMQATLKNMQLLGFKNASIKSGDFFKIVPQPIFDVVMSFGFIEHFTDVDSVIDRHIQWLKPEGTLVLGIPNFSGINNIIQTILNPEILNKHNLDIMNLNYFENIAKKTKIRKKFVGYIGGFDPVMAIGDKNHPTKLQFLTNIFLQITKKIRPLKIFDFINGSKFSSYILAVYEHKK